MPDFMTQQFSCFCFLWQIISGHSLKKSGTVWPPAKNAAVNSRRKARRGLLYLLRNEGIGHSRDNYREIEIHEWLSKLWPFLGPYYNTAPNI